MDNVPGNVTDYVNGVYKDFFFTKNDNLCEFLNSASNLECSTTPVNDDNSTTILKNIISGICLPLTDIFNNSLVSGIFSDQMKIAKVIPMYTSDDKFLLNNYRPISILPVFLVYKSLI